MRAIDPAETPIVRVCVRLIGMARHETSAAQTLADVYWLATIPKDRTAIFARIDDVLADRQARDLDSFKTLRERLAGWQDAEKERNAT